LRSVDSITSEALTQQNKQQENRLKDTADMITHPHPGKVLEFCNFEILDWIDEFHDPDTNPGNNLFNICTMKRAVCTMKIEGCLDFMSLLLLENLLHCF
jgi:hypothetical protein